GVRVHFSSDSPRLARVKGEEVFSISLPKTLIRLQRRDSYRLQLPSMRPYYCHVRADDTEDMALPLYDISVGGFGVQIASRFPFEPLERFEDCWIDLREQGKLSVIAEIRYIMPAENRARKPVWHMGCQLISPALADETVLQRFIARIEVERRSLFET
ncbi:MAG: PilZ domain-containing protein, partial [Candidatus Accumulibacter sp.]|nr:PilZ domain-containing protein [Accumulibacter sp.]